MQPYYELAYALASESLCFFVGTGFSKYLTDDAAPTWLSLLKDCCSEIANGDELIKELFLDNKPQMPLEECASVIALQMEKEGKKLYDVISRRIGSLKATAKVDPISKFALAHPSLRFITTNYDLLIQNDILKGKHCSFIPGFPVNRQRVGNEVYHVHGSIKLPEHMVVTADDYYRFINIPNYFSKKLDALLEENTTVIIGYSLGDINFKSILNTHRYSSSHEINRQHLFFLSRSRLPQHLKDYYDSSYGLRVIESTEIDELITGIDTKYSAIAPRVKDSRELLLGVLSGENMFTDAHLKERESFSEILATLSSTSIRLTHDKTIAFLKDTIQRKHGFTNEHGAWDQYDHLAEWLIQLGSVLELENTKLQDSFLDAVTTSFQTMSKDKILGKSWAAYETWQNEWGELTYKNRALIRRHLNGKGLSGDFNSFIAQ